MTQWLIINQITSKSDQNSIFNKRLLNWFHPTSPEIARYGSISSTGHRYLVLCWLSTSLHTNRKKTELPIKWCLKQSNMLIIKTYIVKQSQENPIFHKTHFFILGGPPLVTCILRKRHQNRTKIDANEREKHYLSL